MVANPNEQEFQMYMDTGVNAAWDRDWATAIDAYTHAIQLLPEDPDAHVNLGLALLNDGQLDKSLRVFRRATQLSPEDPVPMERAADILERMGQLKEAAYQYVKVAEIYLGERDLSKAIGNWERATQLTPGLVSVHARLAQAYERVREKKKAILEYLTLAFNFRRMEDNDKAIRAVERALRLDSDNAQALNMLQALKSGGEIVLPDEVIERNRAPSLIDIADFDDFEADEDDGQAEPRTRVGEADARGPIGEAMSEALQVLAEHVVESGLTSLVGYAIEGMESQRQERVEDAIAAYRLASEGGLSHPALKMNLGGLLTINSEATEAIQQLEGAIVLPELAAGAYHAMGLAYKSLHEHKEAGRCLIQSLQAVDTSLAASADEIEELRGVYGRLLHAIEGRTDEALQAINERFVNMLSGKDWKQRIAETRRHIDETLRDEGDQGVVDFLVAKGGDDLAEAVSAIDRYIRAGLYTLAMDAAHHAVEKSPLYLPIHVRMAEVMMKEGRIRNAITKFNVVARAYMVRSENDRAASILTEVLEMAPLDIDVRLSLIELLDGEGRADEALQHYIDLAATYQQLGDFDKASQTFASAERLAKQIDAPEDKLVEIKHHIADISQMRLNTRQAQRIYEEIIAVRTKDEKALRSLVDIYFSQNNQVEGIKKLDTLLGIYAKKGQINKLKSMLEEYVRLYPQDTALRARLASIYRKLKMRAEAIEQLDALGELQLDAGLNKDAAKTIRQIIAMEPENIEEYRKLLAQLDR